MILPEVVLFLIGIQIFGVMQNIIIISTKQYNKSGFIQMNVDNNQVYSLIEAINDAMVDEGYRMTDLYYLGPMGEDAPTRPIGPQGAVGPTGLVGPTSSTGFHGENGTQGHTRPSVNSLKTWSDAPALKWFETVDPLKTTTADLLEFFTKLHNENEDPMIPQSFINYNLIMMKKMNDLEAMVSCSMSGNDYNDAKVHWDQQIEP